MVQLDLRWNQMSFFCLTLLKTFHPLSGQIIKPAPSFHYQVFLLKLSPPHCPMVHFYNADKLSGCIVSKLITYIWVFENRLNSDGHWDIITKGSSGLFTGKCKLKLCLLKVVLNNNQSIISNWIIWKADGLPWETEIIPRRRNKCMLINRCFVIYR